MLYHNGSGNVAYIKPSAENIEIPYFVAKQIDEDGGEWTFTFTGVIPVDDPGVFTDGEDVIHVYPFVAKYVVITPPA